MTQQRSQGRRPRFWFLINSAFQGDNLLLVLINIRKNIKELPLKLPFMAFLGTLLAKAFTFS